MSACLCIHVATGIDNAQKFGSSCFDMCRDRSRDNSNSSPIVSPSNGSTGAFTRLQWRELTPTRWRWHVKISTLLWLWPVLDVGRPVRSGYLRPLEKLGTRSWQVSSVRACWLWKPCRHATGCNLICAMDILCIGSAARQPENYSAHRIVTSYVVYVLETLES